MSEELVNCLSDTLLSGHRNFMKSRNSEQSESLAERHQILNRGTRFGFIWILSRKLMPSVAALTISH